MLELGSKVLATRRSPAPNHISSDYVDVQLANQWFASSLNLLARTLGEDSQHFKAMQRQYSDYPTDVSAN